MTDFVMRVLKAASDVDGHEMIWWRCDGEYAPITFFAKCNDTFAWACAGLERITPENVADLEKAIADVSSATGRTGWGVDCSWCELFVARLRKMRPQGAAYPEDERLWPLFDACGPEREVGMGNPRPHPSKKVKSDEVA